MPTIAAIDVGSNAIRLAIANVTEDGQYQTLYNVREPVRLGQDVFTKGSISAQTIDRTLQAFSDFKQKIKERAVTHVKAIGTSASEMMHAMMQNGLKPAGSVVGRSSWPPMPASNPVIP